MSASLIYMCQFHDYFAWLINTFCDILAATPNPMAADSKPCKQTYIGIDTHMRIYVCYISCYICYMLHMFIHMYLYISRQQKEPSNISCLSDLHPAHKISKLFVYIKQTVTFFSYYCAIYEQHGPQSTKVPNINFL